MRKPAPGGGAQHHHGGGTSAPHARPRSARGSASPDGQPPAAAPPPPPAPPAARKPSPPNFFSPPHPPQVVFAASSFYRLQPPEGRAGRRHHAPRGPHAPGGSPLPHGHRGAHGHGDPRAPLAAPTCGAPRSGPGSGAAPQLHAAPLPAEPLRTAPARLPLRPTAGGTRGGAVPRSPTPGAGGARRCGVPPPARRDAGRARAPCARWLKGEQRGAAGPFPRSHRLREVIYLFFFLSTAHVNRSV